MADLEKELEAIRKMENEVLERIDERNRNRTIECVSCKTPHPIKELTLIQTHFYVAPSGCHEGDYWLSGEMRFPCLKTGVVNRLLFNTDDVPWEERRNYEKNPEVQFKRMYGHLFREIKSVYEHEGKGKKGVNNYFVDEHRADFGLVEKNGSRERVA